VLFQCCGLQGLLENLLPAFKCLKRQLKAPAAAEEAEEAHSKSQITSCTNV
jgi:hypothetical protein